MGAPVNSSQIKVFPLSTSVRTEHNKSDKNIFSIIERTECILDRSYPRYCKNLRGGGVHPQKIPLAATDLEAFIYDLGNKWDD